MQGTVLSTFPALTPLFFQILLGDKIIYLYFTGKTENFKALGCLGTA